MPTAPNLWTGPPGPLGFADGPTANTAALVDITPAPIQPIMPGELTVGTRIRLHAHGNFSSSATSSTVVWGFYWGSPGVAIGSAVVIAASAAWTWVSTTSALWPWWLDYWGEIRSLTASAGSSPTLGTIKGQAILKTPTSISQFAADQAFPITQALRTVSIDTSIEKCLMVGATLGSVATGAPAVICEDFTPQLIG